MYLNYHYGVDIFGIELGTFVLAASTIVLVCVTGYYAKQTKKTVDVLKETSVLSIRPHLKGTFQNIGPVSGDLLIRNVGNGPATKINIGFWIESKDETKKSWTKPLMMPNDSEEFFIPKNDKESVFNMDFFSNNQTTIRIVGEYYDILNNKYEINDFIDVTAYVKQLEQTKNRYKEPAEEKISDGIDKISDSLKKLINEVTSIKRIYEKRDAKDNA